MTKSLAHRWVPLIEKGLTLPRSDEPGLLLEWFAQDPEHKKGAECIHSATTTKSQMYFSQMTFANVPDHHFIRITSSFKPSKSCLYRFALSVCGKARLEIDGKQVIDLWTDHPPKSDDTACFNKFSMERFADVEVEEGKEYELAITMSNETFKPPTGTMPPGGVRLGGQEVINQDQAIDEAVELAKSVDVPIMLVGLGSEYEYEASDREHLFLPGRANEMITRVLKANPKTASCKSNREHYTANIEL